MGQAGSYQRGWRAQLRSPLRSKGLARPKGYAEAWGPLGPEANQPPGVEDRYRVRLYTFDATAEIVVKVGKLAISAIRRPDRRWLSPFPRKRTDPLRTHAHKQCSKRA